MPDFLFHPNALVALSLAALGVGVCAFEFRQARGTTLVGPLGWLVVAEVAVALSTWIAASWSVTPGDAYDAFRFAAAATTCCPLICLLGAKRPQDRAWHFIVASLWVVLALPAGQALLGRGVMFEPPPVWRVLIGGLIVLGIANSLLTRVWLSGLLYAAGQGVLFGRELMGEAAWLDLGSQRPAWGLALLVASRLSSIAALAYRRPVDDPLDRVWLDFRDRFGALWALRVAERVNAAAALHQWPLALRWTGFRMDSGRRPTHELPPTTLRVLQQNLRNLLRRFVSDTWIDERLGDFN